MKVIFPILPKIVCHGNVPWGIGKMVRIDNIHANTFHLVKKRENQSTKPRDYAGSFCNFSDETA